METEAKMPVVVELDVQNLPDVTILSSQIDPKVLEEKRFQILLRQDAPINAIYHSTCSTVT